jgi:hypothetical protein
MNKYLVLRPVYHPLGPVFFDVRWYIVRRIKAENAQAALAHAKELNYALPVISEDNDENSRHIQRLHVDYDPRPPARN